MNHTDPPIACNLAAIPAERRGRYEQLLEKVRAAAGERLTLPDGYAVRLTAAPGVLEDLAEWIVFERACCPFIRFSLEIEPNGGPVWLSLTGGAGVKDFLGGLLRF